MTITATYVPIALAPLDAFRLLSKVCEQKDPQIIPVMRNGALKLQVWIDGVQTAHEIILGASGEWELKTMIVV